MRSGSILLNSEERMELGAPLYFEQRASTVLFNIISSHVPSGPFLLPANICPIVPLVLCKAGHTFEFIDIDPETLCLDHKAVIARWRQAQAVPTGIIYVRSYGAIFKTDRLFSQIKLLSPKALVIDDRCLCPPDFSELIPKNIDAILYSTGYAKYVDIGFGGFALLRLGVPYCQRRLPYDVDDLESQIDQYTVCLAKRQRFFYHDSDWLDTRLPVLTWADYRAQVEQECERMTVTKSQLNAVYAAHLPSGIQFPDHFQAWRFNIHVENKREVMNTIRANGLFSSGHYEPLTTLFGQKKAPHAENIYHSVINLFNDRYFDIDRAYKLTKLLVALKLTPSNRAG